MKVIASLTPVGQFVLSLAFLAVPMTAFGQPAQGSGSSTNQMLLLDSLGQLVSVPTNEVPSYLRPPPDIGITNQTPQPVRGTIMPPELQQRSQAPAEFRFFPANRPPLMPYLASQDDYGNTAIDPGPLFPFFPLEGPVQFAKYWLSTYGLRYSLEQTTTYVSMTDVSKGNSDLAFYTADLRSKWAIFDAPAAGTAGWVSGQLEAKKGLNAAGDSQSARSNLGTITDPTGIWSKDNHLRMPELAWQQSARNGQIVVVAGIVGQDNYMDANTYADSGRSKFINSALIDSQVLPLAKYNFGFNLQWQPLDEWYAMVGGSMGNAGAGTVPWTDFSAQNWSVPVEIGFAPTNVFDLGPGIYRIQPFAAGVAGATGGGVCFDLEQKLGLHTPLGWFGRLGFGDESVSAGASAQAGTGFVIQGPFKHVLLQRTSNDLLGVGFIWSEPSATSSKVYHENEYGLETVYTLQLTPTIKVQQDFQLIRDPAFHRNTNQAMVFEIQAVLAW